MIHLSLEIDNRQDLLVLLPLLERLRIRYSSDFVPSTSGTTPLQLSAEGLEYHRQIIRQGTDFTGIKDPAAWQQEVRKDRDLPFREE